MADQDEYFYLQPGFDLSSLTIPRIRSILVAHEVSYPSSAKKPDLLEILRHEVIPKSKKLLAAQARVKRTSRGITDIPSSSEDFDGDDDDDAQRMPPPPAPKTPRSRKSKQHMGDDDRTSATPRTARKSRTPSGRQSLKDRPSESETDTGRPSTSRRKSRKSLSSSVSGQQDESKVDDTDKVYYSRRSVTAGESPFSDDNPFQSGSSPVSTAKPTSTSRNRKSLGSSSKNARGATRSPEIKKEDVEYTRSTYEIPVARIGVDRNGVEATEEFTTEANQELQQELASNKQLARSRNSTLVRHQRRPVSTAARTAPMVLLVSILGAMGAWYRQEKISIGYCGVGESNWSLIANPNIPSWVHENVQPQCEPCPAHAMCFSNMEARCDADFVLQQHPLSLGGLVPLPPTCEPDSEKERKIKAVADRAIEELRQRRANYECGDLVPPNETKASVITTETEQVIHIKTMQAKVEIPEKVLKQEVSKMRRKGMSSEEFEDLWRGALGDIINRDEVEVIRDGSGRVELSSSSLAKLPLRCAIRKSLLRAISRNRIPIATVITMFVAAAYTRYRIVEYTRAKAQVPRLVSMTLDRLATQAALQADGRVQEAFISIGQLRDDVLRNVFNAQERERVWQRVRKVVEGNANVRAGSREGEKTGEWSRVWEWIGPMDFSPSTERRRSAGLNIRGVPDGDSTGNSRTWNEGEPIY